MTEVATNTREVREFINIIVAQARAATKHLPEPGLLQMLLVNPIDEAAVPYRYALNDENLIERMISDAVNASEAGHNVYVEGRTVHGVTGRERGKLPDTTAVFALVVDSDADKRAAWNPTVPISLTVETSPGNHHYWLFFETAVDPATGKALGDRLRAATNADSDTGNVCQPYRVAGTINYPGKKKRERGRIITPTQGLGFDPETLETVERCEQEFPATAPKTNGSGGGQTNGAAAEADESSIPADTLKEIQAQDPGKRGTRFWNIMIVLKERGFTIDGIVALFERYPDGIAAKYRGRLRHQVETVWAKLDKNGSQPVPEHVFDPWERYIVPPFPLDILPPVAKAFTVSQSAIIGCDVSGLAMCVLGAFSGALHHGFALKMQRHGNWYERPRLWILCVADPSQRKTPMLKASTRPLVDHEVRVRLKYERELREYQEAKEQGGGKTSLSKPKPPTRNVVWNTTTEKLGELLSRDPKGLLVLSDEISGWLGSMEKYHSNSAVRSDRAFWLIAYDGGPHSYDRITRGEIFIENLSASLLGCIQPERLAEMQGLTSDGLLQRLLPTMMGPATFTQDCACNDDKYDALIRDLIFAKPERLIMTDDALAIMNGLRHHLFEIEQTSAGLPAGFQTWVGKLHGVAGSLALILHMAHDPQKGATYPVGEQTIANVRRLMLDFILPHGYEFYQQGGGSERLRRLASWILTSGKQRVVSSDITTNVGDFRGLTLPQVQEGVSPLVAAGWLEPETLSPACRAWKVTPAVHVQLAERAKSERERKAAIGALIDTSAAMRRAQR